jgi:hypothetical protein
MAFIGNTNTTQAFTPAIDYFSGTGSATTFTLSRPVASVAQVQVTIDNVAQNPSSAYTVSGSTITFTSAPLSGTNNIYVYYTSPITQVIAPGQGTVTATSMASSTGTGAGVFQTSPTITTPTISTITSATATALTLQSAGTTGVIISTAGYVTTPLQPAFYATQTGGAASGAFAASSVAAFNQASINVSNSYDTSTYRFTAPVAGTYFFSASILSNSSTAIFYSISKNGASIYGSNVESYTNGTAFQTATKPIMVTLNVGDYVYVFMGANPAYGGTYSCFLGYLVG